MNSCAHTELPPELSLVIPVYNGSQTIERVVREIFSALGGLRCQIVLVNDGSQDDSEAICSILADRYSPCIVFVQLSRNFGEHNAVLAGLKHASGRYVAVMDDDGQHRPVDILRMYKFARQRRFDVVYGRHRARHHPGWRVLGSRFNDRVATLLLKKPRGLYLSSFKIMSRSVVEELRGNSGPFPYLDGLILRVTRNIGQIDVGHRPRRAGRSGYTLGKLVALWLNMCFSSSVALGRLTMATGLPPYVVSYIRGIHAGH